MTKADSNNRQRLISRPRLFRSAQPSSYSAPRAVIYRTVEAVRRCCLTLYMPGIQTGSEAGRQHLAQRMLLVTVRCACTFVDMYNMSVVGCSDQKGKQTRMGMEQHGLNRQRACTQQLKEMKYLNPLVSCSLTIRSLPSSVLGQATLLVPDAPWPGHSDRRFDGK